MSEPAKKLPSPAEQLLEADLEGGWRVVERIDTSTSPSGSPRSGGYFSVCYLVEKEKQRAFLKAIDMSAVMSGAPAHEQLLAALKQFKFEHDVLTICREHKMSRVIRFIQGGQYLKSGAGPTEIAFYIIFEQADGDARKEVDIADQTHLVWSLKLLHDVALGLSQLHAKGISHQDVKLSNVFEFKGANSKLGDLGRALPQDARLAENCLHIDETFSGDLNYAPPEILYGADVPEDRVTFRKGSDIYMLGSLIFSLFLGSAAAPLLQRKLPQDLRCAEGDWDAWRGTFPQVMPYLKDATTSLLEDLEQRLSGYRKEIREGLMQIARACCEVDPSLRGDRSGGKHQSPYALSRVVSKIDRMSKFAALQPWKENDT